MELMKRSPLLLVTNRPAVRVFLENLGQSATPPFVVCPVPTSVDALAAHSEEVGTATAAVVDAIPDPVAAIQICQELRTQRPSLPMAALLCCPHAVTPWQLRALIATGVCNLLDLYATPEEVLRVLQSVARGDVVLHVRLTNTNAHSAVLEDIIADKEVNGETRSGRLPARTSAQILELLVHGLSDQEIGHRLHLSPHTIKHHIDRLRGELGARNRIELAAWAGRQGFYRASLEEPTDIGEAHVRCR
jgi:DNA-binding NarL/FixJ family response regulator